MKYRVYMTITSSFEIEAPDDKSAEAEAERLVDNCTVAELVNEHGAILHDHDITGIGLIGQRTSCGAAA